VVIAWVEDEVDEEEDVEVDDEAHDATLGSVTPFALQRSSAKVIVASIVRSWVFAVEIPCSTHRFGPEPNRFEKCSRITR